MANNRVFQPSARSHVPPFEVMDILSRVAELRADGRSIVSLCAGEPSSGAPKGVSDEAARIHATGTPPLGYTSPLGTHELRAAIAGHYHNWYGIEVDPRQVAVTTGSSGAFTLAFLAAFNPGDRVALVSPGYPAYRNILTALGIEVVTIATGPATRYQPTPALLDNAIAEYGELHGLILASPANPTGTMVNRAELAALTEWCVSHTVRLVSDEIYHGITYPVHGAADPLGVSAWETDRSGLVISSFSKYWGMTGWRLGWALMPEDLADAMDALAGNFSLCPPAPAQFAALGAFDAERYVERDAVVAGFATARGLLLEQHERLGWGDAAPADGAFYYYADLGPQLERWGTSSAYARALLEEAGVALVPGTDFDPEHGHRTVRLSFAAGEDAVAEAIDRILRFQAG
ncbi:aminotransferase class I/II-fold pyridoxal phosphate-dependent enzyme [Lysinibacter cavernae]|uniref:Aminotransferase n=1 Tax=Lysinibacter cavernae TaxID=1640652 RepID=A0A7X5TTD7_9MICO|nr:aminotransferase class I/II-fold pyridoxal phosphate-dependent enzyme [Lysinibacter cavernae]NIH53168.1 aspartate/methionine/tyrosine aminotransferase [Lysinibacter cavernae]